MANPTRRRRPLPLLVLLPTLVLSSPGAHPAAISYVTGGPTAAAATATVEAAKAVADAFDAATLKNQGTYWTWNYAWTICHADTRPDADPVLAAATARSDCMPSGQAVATGQASAADLDTDASTRRAAVARSTAGQGDRYETDGSSPWLAFLTRIVSIVIDPTPGAEVLEHDDTGWAGMQYEVALTSASGNRHTLLRLTADLLASDAANAFNGYALQLHDSTGKLTASDFTPSLQNGAVTYTLNAAVDYLLRADRNLLTSPGTPAEFELSSTLLVYARSVPEPGSLGLLLGGLLAAGLSRRLRRAHGAQ